MHERESRASTCACPENKYPGPAQAHAGQGSTPANTDVLREMPASGTTLFCIPHAGGSATYYAQLKRFLPHHISFIPLELAGRGRRSREPLATSMDVIARDLLAHIAPVARTTPYAIFGHSMGALLALLCTLQARTESLPLPQAIFLSACAPPDMPRHRPDVPISSLTPAQLWEHVESLGGIPPCISASAEFRSYLEPVLAADFTAIESWQPRPVPPLPVPITIFLGDQDALEEHSARAWRQYTTGAFSTHTFSGHHFYLQDHWAALAAFMSQTLAVLHHAPKPNP